MPTSRPFLITAAALAVSILVLWRGMSIVSLDRLVVGVAALALFGLVFIRTELGLYVVIFSMLLSPEFAAGATAAERREVVIRIEDVLLGIIAVAWLAKTAVNKEMGLVVKTPLNKPIAFYIGSQLIATLVGMVTGTVRTNSGLVYVAKYVEYFVVYYMVVNNLEDRRHAFRLVTAAFLTAAIVSLNGIAQIPSGQRVSAPFEGAAGEPNTFGGYLIFMIAVACGLLLETKTLRLRLALTGLVGIMALPFLYTLSRASYLAAVPVAVVLFSLFPRRRPLLALIIVAGLVIAVVAPPEAVQKRVAYTFQGRRGGVPTALSDVDSSTAERLESYELAIEGWMGSPLLGRGVTGFRFIDAQYPRLLVESGIVGFAAFFWMVLALIRAAGRVYRDADGPLVRGLAGGFVAGIFAILVHGIGSNSFIIIRVMEPFWLVAAVVIALPGLPEAATAARPSRAPAPWRGPAPQAIR